MVKQSDCIVQHCCSTQSHFINFPLHLLISPLFKLNLLQFHPFNKHIKMQAKQQKPKHRFRSHNLRKLSQQQDRRSQKLAPFFNRETDEPSLLDGTFFTAHKSVPSLVKPNFKPCSKNLIFRNVSDFDYEKKNSRSKSLISKQSKQFVKSPSTSMGRRTRLISHNQQQRMIFGSNFTQIPVFNPYPSKPEQKSLVVQAKLKEINQQIQAFSCSGQKTNKVQNFKRGNNLENWLSRIIGNQNKEYARHDRSIMEKIGKKQKKKLLIIHERMWK